MQPKFQFIMKIKNKTKQVNINNKLLFSYKIKNYKPKINYLLKTNSKIHKIYIIKIKNSKVH